MIQTAHRFFFALMPPIMLARRIASAAHWFETEGTPVRADRLHITVFLLADRIERSAGLVDGLCEVGARVAAAPIAIKLDYVSGGGRSIALRPQHSNPALAALYRQLVALCGAAGIAERPNHTFHPHVTLGYRNGRPFGERVAPLGWTADELVLIHSRLGKTRHEVLGRWPFVARPEPQLSLF